MSMTDEEFRRQMLGASRVEILGEAGYDAVKDLRQSRQVHRKLLSSENDLVRFKAVELDHKIHGTLAPLAIHDTTPRFSVNIKLEPAPVMGVYSADQPFQADTGHVLEVEGTNHQGLGVEAVAIQESTPPRPPQDDLARPLVEGSPTQPPRARPPKSSRARRRKGTA